MIRLNIHERCSKKGLYASEYFTLTLFECLLQISLNTPSVKTYLFHFVESYTPPIEKLKLVISFVFLKCYLKYEDLADMESKIFLIKKRLLILM